MYGKKDNFPIDVDDENCWYMLHRFLDLNTCCYKRRHTLIKTSAQLEPIGTKKHREWKQTESSNCHRAVVLNCNLTFVTSVDLQLKIFALE